MNIYQRVNEVRKAVAYMRKEKKVESYMAVTHDQVTGETRDHLIEHGIVVVPSLVASSCVDTGTVTAKGTPFIRYSGRYRFEVINMDDPADKFCGEIEAHAIDHGDKAPGKCLSYAKKAFILKLLEIESGEGEEERQEQKAVKVTSTSGAWDALSVDERTMLQDIADGARAEINERGALAGVKLIQEQDLSAEHTIALWTRFDAKERRLMKEAAAKQKADAAQPIGA